MSGECCNTCRFSTGVRAYYEGYIDCRRYPPENIASNGLRMKFPKVSPDTWCGEFSPKPDQQEPTP